MEWYWILATVAGSCWGYLLVGGVVRTLVNTGSEEDDLTIGVLWPLTGPFILGQHLSQRAKKTRLPAARALSD